MRVDRMGIIRSDSDTTTDTERYGSLYMAKQRHNSVNDYGGSDTADVSKLTNITTAGVGSTCLFSNGDIYRLELSGWAKFGGDSESVAGTNTNTLNLSSLSLDRSQLLGSTAESTAEADAPTAESDSEELI